MVVALIALLDFASNLPNLHGTKGFDIILVALQCVKFLFYTYAPGNRRCSESEVKAQQS